MNDGSDAAPLQGKVGLVTGASRGIGRAIAHSLARLGADVIVTARTVSQSDDTPGTIHETASEVRDLGRRCIALPADMSKQDEVFAVADEGRRELGSIDVLVNNAAAIYPGTYLSFWDMSPDDWRYQVDVNLTGYWLMMKAVAGHMREAGGGTIVNMTSGESGHPTDPRVVTEGAMVGAAYPSTKHAVTRLTADLGNELRSAGIAVVAIHPGVTRTEHNLERARAHGFDMSHTHGVEVPIAVFEHVVSAPDPLAHTGQFIFAPVFAREHSLA